MYYLSLGRSFSQFNNTLIIIEEIVLVNKTVDFNAGGQNATHVHRHKQRTPSFYMYEE